MFVINYLKFHRGFYTHLDSSNYKNNNIPDKIIHTADIFELFI